jgi:TRAP-type C4-dicarboxylate transport system permease small subunit
MKNKRILPCVEEKIMNIDTKKMLLEEEKITAEQFEERNLLNIISVGIFLIAGPLFIYFGFYLLTSPFTVKWGSLSIAIGFLILAFGFSLWQDRQIQTMRRLQREENAEITRLLKQILESKKND